MTVTAVRTDPHRLTLIVEAEFAASVERIWQLWADPRQLERWWGPPTYPATVTTHELAPGRRIAYHMTRPAGDRAHGYWDVLAVEPPRHLLLRGGCATADGTPTTDVPLSTLRVGIAEVAPGRTRLSIETVFPTTEAMGQALAMGTDEGQRQAVGQSDGPPRRRHDPALEPEESHCGHVTKPTNNTRSEKGAATMKLMTITQVSVNGVVQGNGGPEEEDRSGGFERGGRARPLFDHEAMTCVDQVYQPADAFLFGRRTYEHFAGSWGTWDDPDESPIWTALNMKPKYVASTTLSDPRWADTTVLSGDVAAAIGALKATPGGELQVHGSGSLVRWLLDHDLVDEMALFICPVVVGQGARLFPDTGPDIALELVDARACPTGITIQIYRPAGRPQYATGTAD